LALPGAAAQKEHTRWPDHALHFQEDDEPGLRTGAWMKIRVNRGQEFGIGGSTRGTKTLDALIFAYYPDEQLIYVARTRNEFTPLTRAQP
jgi:hypothetical protein